AGVELPVYLPFESRFLANYQKRNGGLVQIFFADEFTDFIGFQAAVDVVSAGCAVYKNAGVGVETQKFVFADLVVFLVAAAYEDASHGFWLLKLDQHER